MYGLTLATAPTTEPVSIAEAKKQCEISSSNVDHDVFLQSLIKAARGFVELHTGLSIITQTWDLFLDRFPECNGPFRLPKAPLQSVTHIKYYDTDGTQQTWSSANYIVSVSREPGRVSPAYNVLYPAIRYQADSINVRFVAGYGLAASVPDRVKQCVLLLVSAWFKNRGDESKEQPLPMAARSLITQLTVGDEFVNYSGVAS